MERIKHGDMEAFQELIEAHQCRVIATVAKMLNDQAHGGGYCPAGLRARLEIRATV